MSRKNTTVRVDPKTKESLKSMSRQLSAIENDEVAIGDVIKRMSCGQDIMTRLKIGSIERKNKRK